MQNENLPTSVNLEELQPDTTRYKALEACQNYRNSWLLLAWMLTEIAYGGDYKEWGYDDFEMYCARELRLSKRQAKKMMIGFNRIKQNRPELLEDIEQPKAVPGYESLADITSARKQEGRYDDSKLDEIEAKVFAGEVSGRDASRAIREARIDQIEPGGDMRQLHRILAKARSIRQDLARCERIPGGMKDRIDQSLLELEALD